MINIRPHHILCIKSYIGKGYSEEFNINMKNIIGILKDDSQKVKIVLGVDDICSECPYNLGNGLCKSQEKVEKMDFKVVEYFNIREDIYTYKELKDMVFKNLTDSKFVDICSNCQWYTITNCKELNLKL